MITMAKQGYHNRIDNGKKWNIIRAARRTGRTWLCIQWAITEPNQQVAFLTPSMRGSDTYIKMIEDMYPGLIRMKGANLLTLANGVTIRFITPNNQLDTHGVRLDKIVMDDAGYFGLREDVEHFINLYAMLGCRFLVTASEVKNDTIFDLMEKYERSDAYYEEYSYLDALKDGVYDIDFINRIKEDMGEERFSRENGPWDTINKFGPKRNKDFKYLLRKN